MTETEGANWTARLGRLALIGGAALSLLAAFIVFDSVPYEPAVEEEQLGCDALNSELNNVYLRWQDWKWTWKSRFRNYPGYIQLLRQQPHLALCDFWLPFLRQVESENVYLYQAWGA